MLAKWKSFFLLSLSSLFFIFSHALFANSVTLLLETPPYSKPEIDTIKSYLFANIATAEHVFVKESDNHVLRSIPGAVIASPSYKDATFLQDYQFHWVRDAALTMDEVATLYDEANSQDKKILIHYLENYISFESIAQNQSGEQLGEPKYNIDGTVWQGPWGRPQYDGPALRALTLIHIANSFYQDNEKIVRDTLLPMIVKDMEFIVSKWQEKNFDLWEELNDEDHFFNKMVQRKALIKASILLRKLKENERAQHYHQVASDITISLEDHWNDARGFVSETIHQQFFKGGGINSAIIMGVVYGNIDDPTDAFAINSDRILMSVYYIRNAFKGLYRVNIDKKWKPPLLGRYPNDVYDGINDNYGNPWFLTSHQLAEYYYTLANFYLKQRVIIINSDNFLFFHQLNSVFTEPENITFDQNPERFYVVIESLIRAGDNLLNTTKKYASCYNSYSCNHMSEQIDRTNGKQISAKDLTWSYATLLTAMQSRLRRA